MPLITTNKRRNKMNKLQYNVEVLVNGRKAREYQKDGMTFIEGKQGTQYQIRVSNHSHERIKTVITVDGKSVLTDDGSEESGYIIGAFDSLKLKGFRLNEDEVSAFVFSGKGDSRAQKRFGNAKNCGVIGVNIYPEYVQPTYGYKVPESPLHDHIRKNTLDDFWGLNKTTFAPFEDDHMYDNNISCNLNQSITPQSLSKSTFDLGTGMGDNIKSGVELVDFESSINPSATFELYYASYKSLKSNDIIQKPKDKVYIPQAFCKKV